MIEVVCSFEGLLLFIEAPMEWWDDKAGGVLCVSGVDNAGAVLAKKVIGLPSENADFEQVAVSSGKYHQG